MQYWLGKKKPPPDFRDEDVLLNKLTCCLFAVIFSQSSFEALLLCVVREAFDWSLPQILVWVGRLAVWEIILQVLMQLHDWRLQLHFECNMDPQQAVLKVLKCRASTFPMWLGMRTITAKHFVWRAPLVSKCSTLFLIVKKKKKNILDSHSFSVLLLFCSAFLHFSSSWECRE